MSNLTILIGDVREKLRELPDASVHCVVTSPPYWALRSYLPSDHENKRAEIGSEATPQEFVAVMVDVFREVRRVLIDDGTCWVNLGDTYSGSPVGTFNGGGFTDSSALRGTRDMSGVQTSGQLNKLKASGLKPKDLCGIPWRVALALQADGWWLRQDIIWHKPSPMPESVTDRCTKAHEYIFLLTKRERYFYDADAISEPMGEGSKARLCRGVSEDHKNVNGAPGQTPHSMNAPRLHGEIRQVPDTRNRRSVWTIASEPYSGAHFATFPTKLVEPCILAGTSAMGCCSICGAPQKRITERKQLTRERPNECVKRVGDEGTGNSCANTVAGVESRTIGWQPSCECGAETMPCTVLDPFFGAGTTGLVAIRAGRRAIGIELNPTYAEMARKRITDELGLLVGAA